MSTKLKEMKRPVGVNRIGQAVQPERNFFADLREARSELEAFVRGSPLSARLVSERSVRRLRVKIGS